MGVKDDKSKEYLADNARFADLCNYKLYDGEQVILPEDLQERDSTEVLTVLGIDEKETHLQKWRDLLKSAVIKSTKNAFYVLVGVENQTDVHYAMPVRSMLYDAMNYGKQVNEAKRRREKNKDRMSSAEFLSGFTKEDKLTPIIPITLYWGTDAWDAPTHMHEMFEEIDEKLLKFIPDYHINLVAPSLIDNFNKFKTELGQTLKFIKYSNDKQMWETMLLDTKNQNLTNETVSAINLFTGSKLKVNEEGEVTNMCLAFEELQKEAAEKAAAETRAEMCLAFEKLQKEAAAEVLIDNVESLMKNLHMSLEDACKGLNHTIEDYEKAKVFVASLATV